MLAAVVAVRVQAMLTALSLNIPCAVKTANQIFFLKVPRLHNSFCRCQNFSLKGPKSHALIKGERCYQAEDVFRGPEYILKKMFVARTQ